MLAVYARGMLLHLESRIYFDGEAGNAADPVLAAVVEAEDQALVARLLAGLPEDARELFLLRVVEGLSAREVGLVVGKSEGAVRVAVYRTMQRLRAEYQQRVRKDAS